jgi:hypothetical protein
MVGPHVLPQMLTGNSYQYMFENNLPLLLDSDPLAVRNMVQA